MTIKQMGLRLPEGIHAQIAQLAAEDLRSLHGEIMMLLREAIERRGMAKIDDSVLDGKSTVAPHEGDDHPV